MLQTKAMVALSAFICCEVGDVIANVRWVALHLAKADYPPGTCSSELDFSMGTDLRKDEGCRDAIDLVHSNLRVVNDQCCLVVFSYAIKPAQNPKGGTDFARVIRGTRCTDKTRMSRVEDDGTKQRSGLCVVTRNRYSPSCLMVSSGAVSEAGQYIRFVIGFYVSDRGLLVC